MQKHKKVPARWQPERTAAQIIAYIVYRALRRLSIGEGRDSHEKI